jgi:hypothetical protein
MIPHHDSPNLACTQTGVQKHVLQKRVLQKNVLSRQHCKIKAVSFAFQSNPL